MTDEEARELGLRSIYAAGHRDAFSGNTCNLYQVKEDGWKFIGTFGLLHLPGCLTKHSIAGNYDIAKMHYEGIGKEPYGYDVRTEAVAAA